MLNCLLVLSLAESVPVSVGLALVLMVGLASPLSAQLLVEFYEDLAHVCAADLGFDSSLHLLVAGMAELGTSIHILIHLFALRDRFVIVLVVPLGLLLSSDFLLH